MPADTVFMYLFFFKQKTAYEMRISDWSSNVCSSDLIAERHAPVAALDHRRDVERKRGKGGEAAEYANADEQPEIFMTDRLAHQESRQQPHDEAADEVDRQDAPRIARPERVQRPLADEMADRKSTRLNSSH